MSINRVMISGNLTRDAEIRSTQSGMAILGFGVAVNDRRNPVSYTHLTLPTICRV